MSLAPVHRRSWLWGPRRGSRASVTTRASFSRWVTRRAVQGHATHPHTPSFTADLCVPLCVWHGRARARAGRAPCVWRGSGWWTPLPSGSTCPSSRSAASSSSSSPRRVSPHPTHPPIHVLPYLPTHTSALGFDQLVGWHVYAQELWESYRLLRRAERLVRQRENEAPMSLDLDTPTPTEVSVSSHYAAYVATPDARVVTQSPSHGLVELTLSLGLGRGSGEGVCLCSYSSALMLCGGVGER
jgi:hypothetical protein